MGLDSLTGFGSFSLTVSSIPHVGSPTGVEFLWAIVIGLGAALAATGIFKLATMLRPLVERRRLLLTPVVGLAVAGLAIAFAAGTGRSSSEVLFSGQIALPTLVQQAAGWTVGALLLLLVCKGLAYAISLSSFRGGPIFPSMFIGAAGGIALSHVGGLPMIAGAAMGVGAMIAGALKMPMTAVLLPSLLFLSDAVTLMPLVIVAVVVSYVVAVWISPSPPKVDVPSPTPAAAPADQQLNPTGTARDSAVPAAFGETTTGHFDLLGLAVRRGWTQPKLVPPFTEVAKNGGVHRAAPGWSRPNGDVGAIPIGATGPDLDLCRFERSGREDDRCADIAADVEDDGALARSRHPFDRAGWCATAELALLAGHVVNR